MDEFTEQERQLLRRLKWAGHDPTGTEDLILVRTGKDGQPRLALCILFRDARLGVCRVEPVALLVTPEEANRLDNPITGKPGLPWIDLNQAEQLTLKDQLREEKGS